MKGNSLKDFSRDEVDTTPVKEVQEQTLFNMERNNSKSEYSREETDIFPVQEENKLSHTCQLLIVRIQKIVVRNPGDFLKI